MAATIVGVYRETAPGERRVALVPGVIGTVRALGLAVLVECGAGATSGFADGDYARAGADIVPRDELFRRADVLVGVQAPNVGFSHHFRRGQTLVALLEPSRIPFQVRHWADEGVTTISLDLAPTTASTAYAHVVTALLERLTHNGSLTIDPSDPLQAAIVVTHHGSVLDAPTWQLILDATAAAGLP